MKKWRRYRYKNLTFLMASLLIAYYVLRNESFHSYLLHLGNLGYIGAFFAGVMLTSTFTVASATLMLLIFAEILHPVELGVIAGAGAVCGDLLIYRYIKDNLGKEVKILYRKVDTDHHFEKLLHSKYFSWTLPVIGALIIASPLSDELGISLIGLSKIRIHQFIFISFVLNGLGVLLVIYASSIIKP